MGNDTGSFLMRLINLAIYNLMHNPKRALLVLFASFAGVLIVGEIVTRVRDVDLAKQTPRPPVVYQPGSTYFDLKDIKDDPIVPSTTQTVIVIRNIPETMVPTETPQPTPTKYLTPTPKCDTSINKDSLAPGKNAKIAYPGGYETEVDVRYNYKDPSPAVGTVKSGETVYILEGPVCHMDIRWWKVNSAKHRIVGWLPQVISQYPLLEVIK